MTAALRDLRAVRKYAPDDVPDGLVTEWLESARWCGSSRNSQPWRFVVVRERSTLASLSHLGDDVSHLRRAPLAIAVAAVEGPYPFSTIFDLGRVVQCLLLAAAADGVAGCIAVFEPAQNIQRAREILRVPAACRLDLAIAFGYPASDLCDRTKAASGRHPLSTLVAQEDAGSSRWA